MQINIQNRSMPIPAQSYTNSPIFQSTINYGTQSIFLNAGLSQSMNLLNYNISTQSAINNNINFLSDYRNSHLMVSQMPPQIKYYNRSLNPHHQKKLSPQKKIYGKNNLKASYIASPLKTVNILPTKYVSNQIFNNNRFATVSKIAPLQDDYHNVKNYANTQIIQQPFKEYYTQITNVTPAINIKPVSFADVTPITSNITPNLTLVPPVITPTPIINFILEQVTTQTPITNITPATPVMVDTPITQANNITYQTEEYKTTNYQNQNKSQILNYEFKKDVQNTNTDNFNSNYITAEFIEMPPEHTGITINSEIIYEDKKINNNINEYYINSPVK